MALVCVFISTIFAVVLQPFKGDVLDYAVAGKMHSLPISRQSKKLGKSERLAFLVKTIVVVSHQFTNEKRCCFDQVVEVSTVR